MSRITIAEKECYRLLDAIKAARQTDQWKSRETRNSYMCGIFSYCKESAAIKRASMDLTRALAEIRKGDYDSD